MKTQNSIALDLDGTTLARQNANHAGDKRSFQQGSTGGTRRFNRHRTAQQNGRELL